MTLLEEIQQRLINLPPEKQNEVLDFITFLQERAQTANAVYQQSERRKRLKQAFATLAELGTFSEIADPVEWQRKIRKDRPLPGREA